MATVQTTAGGIPVLILKGGTKDNKGREAQKNNIAAAKLIAELVKTCLGPRGMDKMLVSSIGDATITNDGATILKEMDVEHPAAKILVEVVKSVDNEVGDGTTSSVVFAGALLEKAEDLINKHPTLILDGYYAASEHALKLDFIASQMQISISINSAKPFRGCQV
jgi:archaeal chaperonin